MTDTQWITILTGRRHSDLTLSEAETVQKMLVDGDLIHIDSAFVNALADLADHRKTKYRGIEIYISNFGQSFTVSDGECAARETDAIAAIMRADDHLSGKHPLPEPEPVDAETVAARLTHSEQQIIDAGLGHLIGGCE